MDGMEGLQRAWAEILVLVPVLDAGEIRASGWLGVVGSVAGRADSIGMADCQALEH